MVADIFALSRMPPVVVASIALRSVRTGGDYFDEIRVGFGDHEHIEDACTASGSMHQSNKSSSYGQLRNVEHNY